MDNGGSRYRASGLFAERQVYVRSGDESRYVVLSRGLQVGVAAGFVAILALLAIASYGAIAKHVALLAEQRAVAEERALRSAQAHQTARELEALHRRSESAEREVERLRAALAQAEGEREEAMAASAAAARKAAELQATLATTERQRGTGAADLAPKPRADVADGAAERQALLAEITGLRAELDRVHRETAVLRRAAAEARQALQTRQSGSQPGVPAQAGPDGPAAEQLAAVSPTEDQMRRLQQSLAGAEAAVAVLSTDLAAAKGAGAGQSAGRSVDAAADLAALKDQLGVARQRALQIGATLADLPVGEAAAALAAGAPLPSPPAPR